MRFVTLGLSAVALGCCAPEGSPPLTRGAVFEEWPSGRYRVDEDRWFRNLDAVFHDGASSVAVADELRRQGFLVQRVGESTLRASYYWPHPDCGVELGVIWIERQDGSAERRASSAGNRCE